MSEMHLRIWGLSMSLMNQLSTLGLLPLASQRNSISVSVGDDEGGMGVAFQGSIVGAWADFTGAPNVPFHIGAISGFSTALAAVPPSSYSGSADVAVIMADLAQRMGLGFENNGVTGQLSRPYLHGTLWDQVQSCASAAGISASIEMGFLVIVPANGTRGGQVPLISPQTGLIGYPAFNANGLILRTLYNPSIAFHRSIRVESDLTPACGIWRVNNIVHELDAETPGGAWFSNILAAKPDRAPVLFAR